MAEQQMMMNGLAPAAMPGAPATPAGSPADPTNVAPSPAPPKPKTLEELNESLLANYGTLREAGQMLGVTREQIDDLLALQDTVSQEDVIDAASKLVANGLEPTEVAGILADMPEGSEALQVWLQGMSQRLEQQEKFVGDSTKELRHQLGVIGLRRLMKEPESESLSGAFGPNSLMGGL